MNRRSLEDTIPGNFINIVSNDAQAIAQLGVPLTFLSLSTVDILISMVIVWMVASWQELIGTCFLFAVSAYGSEKVEKKLRSSVTEDLSFPVSTPCFLPAPLSQDCSQSRYFF